MQQSKGPGVASPGDRPDASAGHHFDQGQDADPHRIGQVGPSGSDET
jgi:hypothetical protein